VALALDVPEETVVQHDRNLVPLHSDYDSLEVSG
jgi:hypothetical protein